MSLLNHSCNKIKLNALNILYFFFEDIEFRDIDIKNLLLNNKKNFEIFFDMLCMRIFSSEIYEKKNYILYELERLHNICEVKCSAK
jgi:negative regulator of genetic competence, sporulation and motility